jgi:hypothetical protein
LARDDRPVKAEDVHKAGPVNGSPMAKEISEKVRKNRVI